MEVNEREATYFSLYPRHLSFLDKVNGDNRSLALRTVLDSIMNGEDKLKKKQATKDYLLSASLFLLSIAFLLLGLYILR